MAGGGIQILPGTPIAFCRIQRNPTVGMGGPDAVYVVEFESLGRRYRCPLVDFQPRTEVVDPLRVEEIPARDAAAS